MAIKGKFLSQEYDKYFYRGKRLTPKQKEWNEEVRKALTRSESWVRKFHAVAEVPQKPAELGKKVTAKELKGLKEFAWRKLPEEKRKEYRQEYEKRYEEGQEGIYFPKTPYKPPSESDWVKAPRPESKPPDQYIPDEYPDEDGWTDTVDSRAEIELWIELTIDSIDIAESPYQGEIPGAREQLHNLVLNAADEYGDYIGFLAFLEDHAAQLTHYAELAMTGYRNPWKGDIAPTPSSDAALSQFATIVNFNRPLSKEQSDTLNQGGNAYWSPFYNQ